MTINDDQEKLDLIIDSNFMKMVIEFVENSILKNKNECIAKEDAEIDLYFERIIKLKAFW